MTDRTLIFLGATLGGSLAVAFWWRVGPRVSAWALSR